MDKAKFERAEAILNPVTPQKTQSSATVDSLVHMRKGTLEYYKYKYEQVKERIDELEKTHFDPKEVPSVLRFDKIKPKKRRT